MQDIVTMLSNVKRPRLLIQAARHGEAHYARDRHLRRLLYVDSVPRPGEAAIRLMEIERRLNDQRTGSDAAYDVARHVEILIAMMGEARLLTASRARA
ncbi:MAG: DUF6477 family protein [Shimia sp.]